MDLRVRERGPSCGSCGSKIDDRSWTLIPPCSLSPSRVPAQETSQMLFQSPFIREALFSDLKREIGCLGIILGL